MTLGVVAEMTRVDDERTVREKIGKPRFRQTLRSLEAPDHRWANFVDSLHLGEVLRRIRLAGKHRFDEVVCAFRPESPVEHPLVTDGGLRNRPQRLAARRSRSVSRPELQVVGHTLEALDRRVELSRRLLHRSLDPRGSLQQVGPTHIADEDEITRKHPDRTVRGGGVGDHEADVLRRVSRRVQNLDAHVADHEGITVVEQDRPLFGSELVFPVRAALVGQ